MARPANTPRYLSLSEDIQSRIHAGEYTSGDRLPSESELCREHGVSRGTVVRAIEQLVAEGIAIRRQGSGTFVARPSMHRRSGRLLSFSQTAISEGRDATQKIIQIAPAGDALAREFHCDLPAVSLVRLRLIDSMPCAYHHSLIPGRVARMVPELQGGEGLQDPHFSLYDAFEKAGCGVVQAEERVTARLAGGEEARLLNIAVPAAVIVVFRRSFDASGALVEAVEAVHHSEYYTYDMTLERRASADGDDRLRRVHSFEAAANHQTGKNSGQNGKKGN